MMDDARPPFQPIGFKASRDSLRRLISCDSVEHKQSGTTVSHSVAVGLPGEGVDLDQSSSNTMPCSFAAVGFKRLKRGDDTTLEMKMMIPAGSFHDFNDNQFVRSAHPLDLATTCAGTPDDTVLDRTSWWIHQVLTLPKVKCTGWVVAQAIDEYAAEETIANACSKQTYRQRLDDAGLQSIYGPSFTPR